MKIINQHKSRSNKHLFKQAISSCKKDVKKVYTISQPFSEQDIIWLQELFLMNGWHYLQVEDFQAGRSIVNTMLYSLNYYHDVACLTIESYPLLDSSYFDIYVHLIEYLNHKPCDLEEFFIEHFYTDFLLIEQTHELEKAEWYEQFIQGLYELKMENHIPIIRLSYL